MSLRIALNRRPSERVPVTFVAKAERLSARKANGQAAATPTPALTNNRTTIIDSASPSVPATSAKKVNQTVNKTPSSSSLYEIVCTTRNLDIAIGSVAVAAAVGVWASKVGTLAASQIVATNIVAFLTPGVTISGFALKTGMFITVNTVAPVMSGLIAISLPIISTFVVTAIAVFVALHVLNKMIQQMKDGMNSGLTTMKDTVTGLPGTLLKQVPGYSLVTSLFSSEEAPLPKEDSAARQERQKKEIQEANTESGSLKYFEDLHNVEENPVKREKFEKTVAVLKGERQSNLAYTPAPSKGLADILEEKDPSLPREKKDPSLPRGLIARPGSSRKQSS